MVSFSEAVVRAGLSVAGIKVNGDRDWDMQVCDTSLFQDILFRGSLGLGEGYVEDKWDCLDPVEFFRRLLSRRLDKFALLSPTGWKQWKRDQTTVGPTVEEAFQVGKRHYDFGNQFYHAWLDRRMIYTCAWWGADVHSLDEAQLAKLCMVGRKLYLRPGLRILDIGCGWGGLMKFLAENYAVTVEGITVSKEQAKFARVHCADLPVSVRVEDYRETSGQYDRIVSLGMFEHTEPARHREYFNCIRRCLADDGIFLLHTIVHPGKTDRSDPWIRQEIFPQGMVPGLPKLLRTIEREGFVVLDIHRLGSQHYQKTLSAWNDRFQEAWECRLAALFPSNQRDGIKRTWEYFFSSCGGAFAAERLDVAQIVMSKSQQVYCAVRP